MRSRTDTPSSSVRLGPKRAPEVLETTGELQLGCAICNGSIPEKETVAFWRLGAHFIVAHIDCALPPARVTS